MNKILTILSAAALLFAACDKIDHDAYTTGTNNTHGSDNWSDVNVQRVLVEKYTGPQCPNCPTADVTLDAAHEQYGDKLIVISINHPTGQGKPFEGQPDMRTEDGTAWDTYFGINGIPCAYINRDVSTLYTGSMGNIIAAIGEGLKATPTCNIKVTAAKIGDSIDINVDLELLSEISNQMTLTIALTEDSLIYKQSLPNGGEQDDYVHNHMLRDVITNTWGDIIPMQGHASEHKIGHFSYTVTNPDIKLENCHIVAFISNLDTRQIINSAQCNITQ